MHLSAVFLLVLFLYTHKDNLLLYSSFVVNTIKPFSSVLTPALSVTASSRAKRRFPRGTVRNAQFNTNKLLFHFYPLLKICVVIVTILFFLHFNMSGRKD